MFQQSPLLLTVFRAESLRIQHGIPSVCGHIAKFHQLPAKLTPPVRSHLGEPVEHAPNFFLLFRRKLSELVILPAEPVLGVLRKLVVVSETIFQKSTPVRRKALQHPLALLRTHPAQPLYHEWRGHPAGAAARAGAANMRLRAGGAGRN